MSERDPRVDPKVGDVLLYGPQWQIERAVVRVVTRILVYYGLRDDTPDFKCTHDQWREWMRSAEVIHRAE